MSMPLASNPSLTLPSGAKSRLKLYILIALTSLIITSIAVPSAKASTVRQMASNRFDLLLDGFDTKNAATTTWGPVVACGPLFSGTTALMGKPMPAAAKLGLIDLIAWGVTLCGRETAICASKAYNDHKWAGMTIRLTPWPRTWCWEY